MKRKVTIRHVAEEAGVSLQTVSRVMNNGPNVRDEVRTRVNQAMAKLGYTPSLAARRMGGSRSFLLLALNDRDRTIEGWRSGEGTDWVDQMLLGGMLESAEHGYRMIFELVDTHSAQVEREVLGALAALHPDGVILTPPHSDNPLITDLLKRQGLPFARIGSMTDGAGFAIAMDDAAAGRAATEHLLGLGHRRIAFITGSDEYALSGARLDGYCQALKHADVASDAALIQRGDFSFASGVRAMEALLDLAAPPTAVVASNDQMALAALQVANGRGVAVPEQLSIVSFDDTPIVRFSHPPLTAITQPIAAMTAEAARLLIRAKAGEEDLQPITLTPFALTTRASTGRPPS
ncbi:LacI family DNA-binding transcriptional regulator [Brevundimonas sp. PAMC22021]|uniref:LacI family DNA-binding transcriptional regulator n=1 Tax=Brevundimonas sp. PAMC22021 TaxID=2861285 RepID=UPI001C6366EA|nr:LacI family DNA-binding transcriptional regulator [Brevundimonas sp. PAMC22021]QYF88141.1 LacI family DNA-binding transcriptional regulator [Brevundimonas sp. PAMC22021]